MESTGHTTSTFQNYRLENKLLQELGKEKGILNLITGQSQISRFIKFIWLERYQLEFITTAVWKSLLFIIYIDIKQTPNSWLFQVVTGYHIKIKLTTYVSLPLFHCSTVPVHTFHFHCSTTYVSLPLPLMFHFHFYNIDNLKLKRMQDSACWRQFFIGIVNISGILSHKMPT